MKVLFSASQRGKKYFEKYYKIVDRYIDKKGYVKLNKDLMTKDFGSFSKELEKQGYDGYVEMYDRLLDELKKADIAIFDVSLHSLSVGYLIERALELNKPVVALYYKNHLPHFLAGVKNDKFQIKEYSDNNLEKILEDSIGLALKNTDKRFNFFIPPKLLNYLEKVSKEQGITKSTFIRNLLLERMHKNN